MQHVALAVQELTLNCPVVQRVLRALIFASSFFVMTKEPDLSNETASLKNIAIVLVMRTVRLISKSYSKA